MPFYQGINNLIRNFPMTGAATAFNNRSPMIVRELWSGVLDTTNIWTVTVTGTGAVSKSGSAGLSTPIAFINAAAAGDTCRLQTASLSIPNPSSLTTGRAMFTKLILEFEAQLGTLANIDNATFLMGLTESGDVASRATANVLGFALAADALNTLTDNAGAETITVVSGAPTLTQKNLYRIEIDNTPRVRFFVNNTLTNTHTTNIGDGQYGIGFRCDAEAATGATYIYLGMLRCYLME